MVPHVGHTLIGAAIENAAKMVGGLAAILGLYSTLGVISKDGALSEGLEGDFEG